MLLSIVEARGSRHEEVGRYWDANAEAWTELVRAGYDARGAENRGQRGIRYERASAVAFMSLMDMPEVELALSETFRSLRPGGFIHGEVQEWIFGAAPPEAREGKRPFRVPLFTRTISRWLNLLVDTGFVLERLGEPYPDDEAVRGRPGLQDAQVVAYFLHVRARGPG